MTLSELVSKNYDVLNENDFYIYQYIVHHQKEVQKMTIYELAEQCNISHTSILRFAKKLGLDGFGELKVYLKWELNRKKSFDRDKVSLIVGEYNDIINDLLHKDMEELLEKIHNAKRVYIYATEQAQYQVAQEMKREFIHSGKLMVVVDGLAELDFLLMQALKDDFFIIISQFGDNESAVCLAKALKNLNIPSLGIALNYKSELAKYVDYYIGYKTEWIQIGKEEQYHCSVPLFLIANMLFIKYIEFTYQNE
ncbi:MAG: MurR/RpiR family transcriptional regulator [Lachnospiraceae bacterium]|nr:MurR/RpiR family transcriptional regulator [Lachnospiraceae bacterium]